MTNDEWAGKAPSINIQASTVAKAMVDETARQGAEAAAVQTLRVGGLAVEKRQGAAAVQDAGADFVGGISIY